MDISNSPYRQGVIGVVYNKNGKLLIVQMVSYSKNDWRFPGGGMDEGESPEDALLRELNEELGSNAFQIKKRSTIINRYDWPEKVIQEQYIKRKKYFRGQEQIQFLVEFIGNPKDLRIDKNELRNIKWVDKHSLHKYFNFPNQYDIALKVMQELSI